MYRQYSVYWSVLAVVTVACSWLALSCGLFEGPSAEKISQGEVNVLASRQCDFRVDVTNPVPSRALLAKQTRDEAGYASEIALSEAVKLFNDELKCYPHLADLPPLEESEVLAAILAGGDYGSKEVWKLQSKKLWQIAAEKIMPKGSLILNADGGRVLDYPLGKEKGFAVEARGQRIYLLLDLDKSPNRGGNEMRPEQFFLVRKRMSQLIAQ
jgi:hypothetical protein